MDILERVVKARSLVSAVLEPPQVIMSVPRPLPQVVVWERVQRPSVLTAIPWNDSYDVGVRAHDNSCVARWNAPPLAVGDDTGDEVDPAVELES